MAFSALLLASCMGDGYADSVGEKDYTGPAIGNNKLEATNVITISELKEKYATQIERGLYKQVDEDIKILGIVTGNDLGGNLYNQICLQDKTGGILVCIGKSGLYGELPVGQQVLIDCKGLYIGGYGKQAQIGGIYTNLKTGATFVGKMDRPTWQKHFKLLDEPDASNVKAEVFDLSKATDATYLDENAGKLMTIKGVKFTSANGKTVWAANDETSKQYLKDAESGQWLSSNTIMVYTSGYARFANAILPEGAFDITGIFTRYNNTWQIIIRNTDDLSPVTLDKGGTLEEPYTVTKALEIINAGTFTTDKVYTTGIICEVNDIDTSTYGNATYSISVDGKVAEGKTLKVFRGYNIGGEKWTEATKGTLAVGKKVVILGSLTLYNGVAEINSGNQLISIQ